MKKPPIKNFFLVTSILVSLVTSATLTYSWFGWMNNIGRNILIPGEMNSTFEFERWNNTAWVTAPSAFNLGEINDISKLPPNSNSYLKFRALDSTNLVYIYQVIVERIDLSITNEGNTHTFPNLNYYSTTTDLRVFDYHTYVGADNLNPTTVFANYETLTATPLDTLNESFTGTTFIDEADYLYVLLVPRLEPIQNMIDLIPLEYAPYAIQFDFNFIVEVRNADE